MYDDRGPGRVVYAYAADPEVSAPDGEFVREIRAEIRRVSVPDEPLDELLRQAGDWAASEEKRFRGLLDGADERGDTAEHEAVLVRRALLGCAPLSLMAGAWLQWLSAPGTFEDPLVLRTLALYASDVGVGHPHASRGDAFLDLLRRLRLAEHAAPAARLVGDQRIPESAFRLPALLLAMSRRPDDFHGELLGADLCLRSVGLLPALSMVRHLRPTDTDWEAVDLSLPRTGDAEPPIDRCRALVDELITRGGADEGRAVHQGFAWALQALREWSGALRAELLEAGDPAFDMAELMRLRSREGAVYHQQFRLEEKPLSCWLAECAEDTGPLLAALARSKLVKPGRSSASSLVRGLVGERGPMFRVFSPEDLAVICRWIDSLPATDAEGSKDAEPGTCRQAMPAFPAGVADALRAGHRAERRGPASVREAYHQLMQRTDTPELRSWCEQYVVGWLARSRHGMDERALPLPVSWRPEGLRPWLQERHDRHGEEFERNVEVPLPTREAVVDDTVQTAPLTLIDGSWLQGFTDYGEASSEIGQSLFETYWDELGNGEARLNHPRIYREVLEEMDVHLPPTASEEFARWPGFRDASFELPVYWLCIGRYPRSYLPEVLGLNLAMELSGVGGTYRRARLALKSYGFSTRFVDIHNTIDNVATGHSAWAADAVDTLMAALPETGGPGGRADTWQRVRTGYRSLNPPSGPGARLAAWRGRRSVGSG